MIDVPSTDLFKEHTPDHSRGAVLRRLFGRNSGDPRIGRLARSGYTTRVRSFGSALVCTPRISARELPQSVRHLRKRTARNGNTSPLSDRRSCLHYAACRPAARRKHRHDSNGLLYGLPPRCSFCRRSCAPAHVSRATRSTAAAGRSKPISRRTLLLSEGRSARWC